MSENLISIIMTVRNGELYLKDCLESIINQSYENWELVVVNNQSSDSTQEIIDSYNNEPRIRPLYNSGTPNIPSALHLAIENINGKYITRMDADDLMPEYKLDVLLSGLKNDNEVAVGLVKYFSNSGVKKGYASYEQWLNQNLLSSNPYSGIYKECIIPAPGWLMARSTFESIGGIDPQAIPEDYDLAFRCYQHKIQIKPVNEIVHYWRDYETRNSRHDPDYQDNNFFELKVKYFLKIDHDPDKPLILWGAGKKGKEVAQLLISKGIDFLWITDNQNKIGKNIYGKIIHDTKSLLDYDEFQVITVISSPTEQTYIKSIEEKLNASKNCSFFGFC